MVVIDEDEPPCHCGPCGFFRPDEKIPGLVVPMVFMAARRGTATYPLPDA